LLDLIAGGVVVPDKQIHFRRHQLNRFFVQSSISGSERKGVDTEASRGSHGQGRRAEQGPDAQQKQAPGLRVLPLLVPVDYSHVHGVSEHLFPETGTASMPFSEASMEL
jgi:hypothetical protein